MSITQRIQDAAITLFAGTRVGNAIAAFFDRYEAALPGTPDRRWLPALMRDARFDANSFSRYEMARKILYFERNSWLVQHLREEFIKWVIGPDGLKVVPCSSDTDWNEAMLESYLEWSEQPCLDSTLNMAQVHRLEAGTYHLLGEAFCNETRLKLKGKPSRPAIQLIDCHRCSSPGVEYSSKEQEDLVDGVQLGVDTLTGKVTVPIGYWVREGFVGDAWTFRGVEQLDHIFDPERIGMYRGITPYHACMNALQDFDELDMMEMQRAKANAEEAKVFKTRTGSMPVSQVMRSQWNTGTGQGQSNISDFEKRVDGFRRIVGSRSIALFNDEELTTPTNPSPSAAQQWLWRMKISQVCQAVGFPLVLIFPEMMESAQGTVVRGCYNSAQQFVRGKFHLFACSAARKYRFYANWARYNDPRCADAPADWAKCDVQPTRGVNVDIGNNSAAELASFAAGTTTLGAIAAQQGTTAASLLNGKAMDVAMCKVIAKRISDKMQVEVKPEEIMGDLADIASKLQSSTEPDEDDIEDPKKKEMATA